MALLELPMIYYYSWNEDSEALIEYKYNKEEAEHLIDKEKCEAILEKYKKKVPKMYRNSLSMLWLNLSPSYKKIKKCKRCCGFGMWALGDACPMGPMDAGDGCPTIACSSCGANKNPINKKKK
jgi:hypothetical protein